MDNRKKSFEKFIEKEMAKSPEQILKEVTEDPNYPKFRPSQESYEKLKKRVQEYEAMKAEAEKADRTECGIDERIEKVKVAQGENEERIRMVQRESTAKGELIEFAQEENGEKINAISAEKKDDVKLSQKEQEKMYVREEERVNQKMTEEKNKNEMAAYRKAKRHRFYKKAVVAAATTLVLTMGLGVSSMGGPKYAMTAVSQMFMDRSRTTVDTDSGENILIVEGDEEEKAYEQIKDVLGFDPVRMGYMPENVTFQKMEFDKESQDAYLFYESDKGDIIYMMQKQYTDGKNGFDVEDTMVKEYQMKVEGRKIRIAEYYIKDLGEKTYLAEFTYNDTWYCLSGVQKKKELEKIVKNLIFF